MRAFIVLSLLSSISFLSNTLPAAEGEHASHEAHLPKKAVCVMMPTTGNKVEGVLTLSAGEGFVQITGTLKGLSPGKHGFHIHEFGDLTSTDGESAGGHFNPAGGMHGGLDDKHRHAGDLGNILAKTDGTADVAVKSEGLELHFIVGRSLVVHAKEDDFKTQPSGNSGPRIAVGVIGITADKEAKTPAKR